MKNASSQFDFNSDHSAQGPANPARYNAPASRSPRRAHSGKRSVVAGMTSISLALAGLTVPGVVGGEIGGAYVNRANAEVPMAEPGTYLRGRAFADGDTWVHVVERVNNTGTVRFDTYEFAIPQQGPSTATQTDRRAFPESQIIYG